MIGRAVVQWGRLWPAPSKPNVHPAPRPVKTLRPQAYVVQVSANGRRWLTVGEARGQRTRVTDTFTFPKVKARFVRVKITKGTEISVKETVNDKKETIVQMPMLEELTVTP